VLLAAVVNIYSWHLPYFWDTILTSTIANHYYLHGFGNFIIPQTIDAGHPPLFYIWVTVFYKLFGRSLFAAHFSMLPFTLLSVHSFIRILQFFQFSRKQQLYSILLFFSISAVCTQNMLVSYDGAMLALYLLAVRSYLYNRRFLFVWACILLSWISLRGLFCVASIHAYIFCTGQKQFRFKWLVSGIPAIAAALGWYGYHYAETGWLFISPVKGWESQRAFASMSVVIKNMASICRCCFDFGLSILFLSALFFVISRREKTLSFLWLFPFVLFSICFLPFSNPVNHRYYLIVYVLLIPPAVSFFAARNYFLLLMALILLLGNFLIYPGKISNGWDCTLAHVPYYALRKQATRFIDSRHLHRAETGTVFPMNTSFAQTDLSADTLRMINVNGISIDTFQYVLYSNAGNDFSDRQIDQLKAWQPVWHTRGGMVEMTLYRNPHYEKPR
jgi:hypothetical protein